MMEPSPGFRALADTVTRRNGADAIYDGSITENWRQGRTAYGGLTAGLCLVAVRKEFPDLAPLRSVAVNFIGPVTRDPVFHPVLLRQGRNVTSVEVRVESEDVVVASCTFVFGAARASHLDVPCPAPEAMAVDEAPPFIPPEALAMVPVFMRNFDTRLVAGARPTMGSEGCIRVWSRHHDAPSREGAASFLTLGDVLPPAATPLFKQMGPISSVNWMMNIINDPITQDGWWHVETSLTAAREGYSSQVMRFWNSNGELVADGMQCVAIFV